MKLYQAVFMMSMTRVRKGLRFVSRKESEYSCLTSQDGIGYDDTPAHTSNCFIFLTDWYICISMSMMKIQTVSRKFISLKICG